MPELTVGSKVKMTSGIYPDEIGSPGGRELRGMKGRVIKAPTTHQSVDACGQPDVEREQAVVQLELPDGQLSSPVEVPTHRLKQSGRLFAGSDSVFRRGFDRIFGKSKGD